MKRIKSLLLSGLLLLGSTLPVAASQNVLNIEEVTSASGITAWLVRSEHAPTLSIDVVFQAGMAFDPDGKEGLSSLASTLVNESVCREHGSADIMPTAELSQRLKKNGASLSATTGLKDFTVSLQTLTDDPVKMREAFQLLSLGLSCPAFTSNDLKRMRASLIQGERQSRMNPGKIAQRELKLALHGEHPYSKSVRKSVETLQAITADDLRAHRAYFTRSNMVVGVVGNITADELRTLLDSTFAHVPEGNGRRQLEMPLLSQAATGEKIIPFPTAQAKILVGHLAHDRSDPDYIAARLMNKVLAKRLYRVLREENGLVYSAFSYFALATGRGSFVAQAATGNKTAHRTKNLLIAEVRKMREHGVTAEEFDRTLKKEIGSFPLGIAENSAILGYLTYLQTENLGKDRLDVYLRLLKQVTLEDINRTAREKLKPEELAIIIVGQLP